MNNKIAKCTFILALAMLAGCAMQPGGYGYNNYPAQQEATPWSNTVTPYYGGGYGNRGYSNDGYNGGDNRGDGYRNNDRRDR
jgi:hypothetical protein